MIKINLTLEQKNSIKEKIKNDIDTIVCGVNQIYEELNKKNFFKIAELINNEKKIEKICLLSEKKELHEFNENYKKLFDEDKKGKNENEIKYIEKYITEEYEKIYNKFSKRNVAYDILKIMELNVCPYCNRQFIFTIKKKTRPEFDHFFPKSEYPFLAVSIYNLIPCCGLCNKFKSNSNSPDFLYPYEDSFEDKQIYFEIDNIINKLYKDDNLNLRIKSKNEDNDKIIKIYKDKFKIEEIYMQHLDYAGELIKKIYIFNDDAIESIYNSYNEIFSNSFELKKLILGMYYDFNQQPLSKFTNDILKQCNF